MSHLYELHILFYVLNYFILKPTRENHKEIVKWE